MTLFENTLALAADIAWGRVAPILILGTGLYLTVGLRGISFTRLPEALRLLANPSSRAKAAGAGEITPFGSLMTALGATIGVGNIAGVATAIHLGGPGAVFWIWVTGLVGMATKYSETLLAVTYRQRVDGYFLGGPMHYIRARLGPNWGWLGTAFAGFATVAALAGGASVQANSIADVVKSELHVPTWVTAAILTAVTLAVLIGGIKRIAAVSAWLAPAMIILFVGVGLFALASHVTRIPGAFSLIFTGAFSGTAVTGGFVGASAAAAMRYGLARGAFCNEAGLGTAGILHATAKTDDAVRMAATGMLGTFIDTLIVSSITSLVIITSGAWMESATGAPLTAAALNSLAPGFGSLTVCLCTILFGFTTIIGWSVYGERAAAFLFGARVIVGYRYLWCLVLPVGAVTRLDLAWTIADVLNAMMAVPNLTALLLLSPVIFRITHQRLSNHRPLALAEVSGPQTSPETIFVQRRAPGEPSSPGETM